MQAALNARDMGLVMRAFRQHPYHGTDIAQEVAASWVGISQSRLSRIERGGQPFTETKLMRWAHVLGIPSHLRWFSMPASASSQFSGALAVQTDDPYAVVVEVLTLTGERVPVAIDRRAFLSGALSVPLVGLADDASRPFGALPAIADGSLHDVVRSAAMLRTALIAQDNVLGPAVAAPAALHQLSVLQHLSQNATNNARQALIGLQAAYAEFIGWFADDLGDRRSGQYWIDRALEWAHEADDEVAIGYVLARKAQRAADDGDTAAAISLAEAAQKRGALLPRVRAAALLWGALGHAANGNGQGFRVAIEQAKELVNTAPVPGDGERAHWCTPDYVVVHEAAGYMRLREPTRAVVIYESGLRHWPNEFRRDQGLYYSRLARAYAAAREPERAVESGRMALTIGTQTRSGRILSELKDLSRSFDTWKQMPTVVTFAEELRALPTAPATGALRQIAAAQ
jgi:transcriptional regulator with XRE-family HTH domain